MTRRGTRGLVRQWSGALAGVALLSAGALPAAAETTLTYVSYGGALQKAEEQAWLNPYMEANPDIKILYDVVD